MPVVCCAHMGLHRMRQSGSLFKAISGKSIPIILFALMLTDTFCAPKGSTPGQLGALFLAWGLFLGIFLPPPSLCLNSLSVAFATACLASNHGMIATIAPLRSLYFYIFGGLLIAWWNKIAGFSVRG
jgi:hypothetical protein